MFDALPETESVCKSKTLDLPRHLQTFLQHMRDDESSHDIVFKVGNELFSAHRVLVAAVSPVLGKMLETSDSTIPLRGMNTVTWNAMLDYMYTGQMNLGDFENTLRILECANKFHVDGLEQSISDYIGTRTDAINCCQVLDTANRINSASLKRKAMELVCRNFHAIWRSKWFPKCEFEIVREILENAKLTVDGEHSVFVAALRWIMCSRYAQSSHNSSEATAKKVAGALSDIGFIDSSLVESFYEPGSCSKGNIRELLDCVNISAFSCDDLRLIGRFCLEFIEFTCTDDLFDCFESFFNPKVFEELVKDHHYVPNLPVKPCKRVVRGRNDVVFTFFHRFHDLGKEKGSFQKSPLFVDKYGDGKWRISLYIEREEEYYSVFCFLWKNPEDVDSSDESQDEESTEEDEDSSENEAFSCQLFVRIVKEDGDPESKVFAQSISKDDSQNNSIGSNGKRFKKIVIPTPKRHESLLVGVAIYREVETRIPMTRKTIENNVGA